MEPLKKKKRMRCRQKAECQALHTLEVSSLFISFYNPAKFTLIPEAPFYNKVPMLY